MMKSLYLLTSLNLITSAEVDFMNREPYLGKECIRNEYYII